MTIASTLNRVSYDGNGTTTAFPVSFPFQLQADLVVVETIIATGVQTTKTLTTHYTISGTVDTLGFYSNGGTVNALTAPASTVRWTIYRDPSPTQSTDLVENDSLPAESTEAALDRQTMLIQRVRDLITRSLRQPDGDSANVTVLPPKVDRASKYAAYDANGNPVASSGTTSILVVTSYIETLLDDANSIDARSTLGFPTISGSTQGHALITDPFSSGLAWGHRAQKNPIINGNMEVWQRGTTFAAAATASFSADRWGWETAGAGVVTVRQSTNVPTVAAAGVLFNYSLEADVTTADASLAATDLYALYHKIEGYNWRHFAQRIVKISFWAMSSKTGIHGVSVQNSGADRTFVQHYTIGAADTWEQKEIYVDASPSGGTWDYTTGTGLILRFPLAAGSNFTTASIGAWNSNALHTSASHVNVMDNTANFFRITGVKIELGGIATPIQFVPFEEELARCQRYYQKSFAYATAPAQSVSAGAFTYLATLAGASAQRSATIPLTPRMRPTPTITLFNPNAANAEIRNQTDGADLTSSVASNNIDNGFLVQGTGTAGTALGELLAVQWTAAAEL